MEIFQEKTPHKTRRCFLQRKMDENYTNVHRAFLQACGRFSVLNVNQALDVFASVQAKRKSF